MGQHPSGAEAVGSTLAALGVRRVFGVVGSGNFMVTDALVRGGAQFYGARHESGAASMADACWRASGEVAVCSVHQGPGLTNAGTALGEAAKSRVPLVVVAGVTSAGALRSNFAMDQHGFAESVGCIAEQIHRPETVVEDTERAFRRAREERRPVILNLPLDVQALPAEAPARRPALLGDPHPVLPEASVLDGLAERLLAARRPLLLGGRGAWLSGAGEPLQALAETLGARLATTAVAKGLFTGHPSDVGIAGGFSDALAVETLESADLILAVGASLTHWTTRSETVFAEGDYVVQIDAEKTALGLNRRVDLGVLGDAALSTQALLERVRGRGSAAEASWRAPLIRPEPFAEMDQAAVGQRCHPAALTAALEEMLPAERTVVLDGGHFIGWPAMGMSVPDPAGFLFTSAGFQSIGLGTGAAVGAALARPDRVTFLASGDGGFLMAISELETMTRLQLPVLVAVYNDSAYGAEVHHFRSHGSGMELVQFPETDIAAMARAAGAEALTVRSAEDLAGVRDWLAAVGDPAGQGPGSRRPLVLDVTIDPDIVGPWAEQDFAGH